MQIPLHFTYFDFNTECLIKLRTLTRFLSALFEPSLQLPFFILEIIVFQANAQAAQKTNHECFVFSGRSYIFIPRKRTILVYLFVFLY